MGKIKVVLSIVFLIVILHIVVGISNKRNSKVVEVNGVEISITYPYHSLLPKKSNNKQKHIGFPQEIIAKTYPFNKDTIYAYALEKQDKRCCIFIPADVNSQQLRFSLIDFFKIKSKAVAEPAYLLLTDSMQITREKDGTMLTTLPNLVTNARYLTGAPIVLKDTSTTPFSIDTEFLKIKDIQELSDFLYQSCNLKLIKSDSLKCVRITYY